MPRCRAVTEIVVCTGSIVQVPAGSRSSPPILASDSTPSAAEPLAVTTAVRAVGAKPFAVRIAVYEPAGSGPVASRPSSSATTLVT